MDKGYQGYIFRLYETALYHQKPQNIITSFKKGIMENNLTYGYRSDSLTTMVLGACLSKNNLDFAEKVWDYINKYEIMKPTTTQVYFKMISVYHRMMEHNKKHNDQSTIAIMWKAHKVFMQWSNNIKTMDRDITVVDRLLATLVFLNDNVAKRDLLYQYLFFMLESNMKPTKSTRALLHHLKNCTNDSNYHSLIFHWGQEMFQEWLQCKECFHCESLRSVIFRSFEIDESEWTNFSLMQSKNDIMLQQNSIFYINLLIVYFHKIKFASPANSKLIIPWINKVYFQWCDMMMSKKEMWDMTRYQRFDVILLNQMLTILYHAKLDLNSNNAMLYAYLNTAIVMNVKPDDTTTYWLAKLAGMDNVEIASVINGSNATTLLQNTRNLLWLFATTKK